MKKPFVYLIRKRGLGDVLWIEPIIRQLAYKNNKVIVYTKYKALFENYPLENVFFKEKLDFFEKVLWKVESVLGVSFFFLNLEMAYESKPKMHLLHAYEMKAGFPQTIEYPHLYLSQAEKNKVLFPDGKYVVLHLESLTDKNYRKVYGLDWENIVNYLRNKQYHVLQIGKLNLNIPGTNYISTNIREMMTLIRKASFFIGLDSGPSHIASSLNIPALILFGAVNPEFRHFKSIFRGYFLQQFCEFAGCYHEQSSLLGPECKLVGNEGIPKCSLHTDKYVIQHIELIINEYVNNDK